MNRKNKLKITREQKGLTQVQIAEQAGITETSYQRIEYGKQIPRADTAILIARALNSTVEELFLQRKDTTNGNENQKI